MIKNLKDYIGEAIQDANQNELIKAAKQQIKDYLKQHYKYASFLKISKTPDSDGKYIVTSDEIETKSLAKLSHLTNGLFKFGPCKDFKLVTLVNLVSLEGAPQEVARECQIRICPALKSLKGGPQSVGYFECNNTGIVSLEGGPTEVAGYYMINDNDDLKSLKGAPKVVHGDFDCRRDENQFDVKDVKAVCKVKGDIMVSYEEEKFRGGQGRGFKF